MGMDTISSILDDSVSTSVHAVLASLKPEDVKVIDAIIGRASSATTFLTVFKAYNEVLAELNLDAEEDVVYYKFLLKLGVVRGRTWGEKWSSAKTQHGYQENLSHTSSRDSRTSFSQTPKEKKFRGTSEQNLEKIVTKRKSRSLDYQEGTEELTSGHSFTSLTKSNAFQSTGIRTPISKLHSEPSTSSTLIHPSLHALKSTGGLPLKPDPPLKQYFLQIAPSSTSKANYDSDDAWEKLRLARYDRIADDFYTKNLLTKCLDVWRRGAEWIHVCVFFLYFKAELNAKSRTRVSKLLKQETRSKRLVVYSSGISLW